LLLSNKSEFLKERVEIFGNSTLFLASLTQRKDLGILGDKLNQHAQVHFIILILFRMVLGGRYKERV
jgi:hypothetical protein